MGTLTLGFFFVIFSAFTGGAFGLQYRVQKVYTVDNSAFLSVFIATIVLPLIVVPFLLPGWTDAIARVGWGTNLLVYALGFGWGMGAITYAFGFNLLGLALAGALIKGISVAVGAGIPLIRRWGEVEFYAKGTILLGIILLVLGTVICGKAGILRERFLKRKAGVKESLNSGTRKHAVGKVFWVGFFWCLISGLFSAFANLGYDFASPLEDAMVTIMGSELGWKATLIRWMPMYWGGMTALIIFMGGSMIKKGTWKNYFAPGTKRDCCVSIGMGVDHFMAQIPYGIGAFYLGALGTTIGWGIHFGVMMIVVAVIGFILGEWKSVPKKAVNMLLYGIGILIVAMGILAYSNSLV